MDDIEKYRMDSTTDVEDLDEPDKDDADLPVQWRSSPTAEKVQLRFSFSHASQTDDPYRKTPSRQSRFGKPGSRPTSQAAFQEHSNDRPWRCGDPHRYAPPRKANSWQRCRKLADKYDDEMCSAWKEEVDKLLIFAGLFSATITAFTVESYKWLRAESQDASAQLLAYLTAQLTKDSAGPLPPSIALQPFSVSSADVRINAMWFLSLTLSLTTVFVGILCLQWLREYQRDAALPHKDAVALRQMRFEGLLYWRVPEMLSFLPLLLQVSLILFFVGLLDLLWSRNPVVATCVTPVAGLVLVFILVTTALPALQHAFVRDPHLRVPQCPYKSPQSWSFYTVGHTLFSAFVLLFGLPWSSTLNSTRFHRLLRSTDDSSWLAYDMRWRRLRDAAAVVRGAPKHSKDGEDLLHALHWLNANFTQSVEAVYPLHACLTSQDLSLPSVEKAISDMYLELGQIDAATFRVMLDDRYSPREAQKRDIVSAYYLHLHKDAHPVLTRPYVESVLRILNTQVVPRPFYDWLSEILIELSGKAKFGGDRLAEDAQGLRVSSNSANGAEGRRVAKTDQERQNCLLKEDEETVVQVLMCVRGLIAVDSLRVLDVVMTWNLLYSLLHGFSDDPGSFPDVGNDLKRKSMIPPPNSNERHLALIFSIIDELEGWLVRGKDLERWERVKLCAEGVLKIFPPLSVMSLALHLRGEAAPRRLFSLSLDDVPLDDTALTGENDSDNGDAQLVRPVVNLIRNLDDHMARMGGATAVLLREKWWHEYWDVKFDQEDWRALLQYLDGNMP